MIENLFKLACLMFSATIAFTYLVVSFENQASDTKVVSAAYKTVSGNTAGPVKKKNCSCCAERIERGRQLMERRRKMVQQAQKRAPTEQSVINVSMTQ